MKGTGGRMNDTKYALFKIGTELYGLDIMNVETIEKNYNIMKVPDAPVNIKGVIDLRGEIIPVYSLNQKFGFQEKESNDDTRLIITKSNGISMAYEVDYMQEIIDLDEAQIQEAPAIIKNAKTTYIKKIAKINDNSLAILLDQNSILSGDEQEQIIEVKNAAAEEAKEEVKEDPKEEKIEEPETEAKEEKAEEPETEAKEEKVEEPETEAKEEKVEGPETEAKEVKAEEPEAEAKEEKVEEPEAEAKEVKAEEPEAEAKEEKAEEPKPRRKRRK